MCLWVPCKVQQKASLDGPPSAAKTWRRKQQPTVFSEMNQAAAWSLLLIFYTLPMPVTLYWRGHKYGSSTCFPKVLINQEPCLHARGYF